MKIKEKLEELIRYVPGYRSGVMWKEITAFIYYVFWLTVLVFDPTVGGAMLLVPIIIFGIIEALKVSGNKQAVKDAATPYIIMLVIITMLSAIMPGL